MVELGLAKALNRFMTKHAKKHSSKVTCQCHCKVISLFFIINYFKFRDSLIQD